MSHGDSETLGLDRCPYCGAYKHASECGAAERDRLREALERIAAQRTDHWANDSLWTRRVAREALAPATCVVPVHRPRRDDDVAAWLKRKRDLTGDDLLDRYRECADYGLTLRPEDDMKGDH